MLVIITERAETDLLDICRFLGPSRTGERLVADFERIIQDLRQFPNLGRTGHPLAGSKRARTLFMGDYVMTYEVVDDRVFVRRILHGARDPESFRSSL